MSEKDNIMKSTDTVTATIPAGSTTSDVIYLGGMRLFAIKYPAALTGTSVSVIVGLTADDMGPLCEQSGTAVTVAASAGKNILVDPQQFHGWKYVQIISNASEVAARSLKLNLSVY